MMTHTQYHHISILNILIIYSFFAPEKKPITVMWWWIIWHLYWDWGHIVGEFPYPDTSAWTDEELGIPPDDYDE